MTEKKEDRRIRKTRRLLQQGLCDLMQKKELRSITVRELTDYVDINRGTFYLHYRDIYDLLEKIEDEVLAQLQDRVDTFRPQSSPVNLLPILEPFAQYIEQHYDLCCTLFCNTSSDRFFFFFQRLIQQNGHRLVQNAFPPTDPSLLDNYLLFIANGITGLLRSQMANHIPFQREKLVQLCHTIIISSATGLFGPPIN